MMKNADSVNPWVQIPLSSYENHMKLEDVLQLQTLNSIMKEQICEFPISSVAILGIAGGNGLEHVNSPRIKKVYGVDINEEYLMQCKLRYDYLTSSFEVIKMDLMSQDDSLPFVDLIVANLLVEYIGIDNFVKHVHRSSPSFVSVVIQQNNNCQFVSESPYLQELSTLHYIHTDISMSSLIEAMEDSFYTFLSSKEYPLPNGKSLVKLDFKKSI